MGLVVVPMPDRGLAAVVPTFEGGTKLVYLTGESQDGLVPRSPVFDEHHDQGIGRRDVRPVDGSLKRRRRARNGPIKLLADLVLKRHKRELTPRASDRDRPATQRCTSHRGGGD
jgi:hypothetical protein